LEAETPSEKEQNLKDDLEKFEERPTIVITGANGMVGRALLKKLQQTSAWTVALLRSAVELPANQVIVGPLDSPASAEIVRKADYVVHLAGTLFPLDRNSYHAANVETTQSMVRDLKEGGVKRILFLSYVGADEVSKNVYLRTKATAENLLRGTGKEVIIFRCTHIIGSPESPGPLAQSMLAKPGRKVGIVGKGDQIVAPLYLRDVVTALIVALKEGKPGTYELAGPDKMTMNDLARLLNRNPQVRLSHLPQWMARALGTLMPKLLPRPFVEVIMQDSVGDPSRAAHAFGLRLTSLRTIWR
jgi:nucleoside-diphosphate-sugar epimerase